MASETVGVMVGLWWGYGGLGYTLYSSTIVVLVVVNHHHEMKSTGHKFFAQQIFTPHSPFLGSPNSILTVLSTVFVIVVTSIESPRLTVKYSLNFFAQKFFLGYNPFCYILL